MKIKDLQESMPKVKVFHQRPHITRSCDGEGFGLAEILSEARMCWVAGPHAGWPWESGQLPCSGLMKVPM